MKKTALSLIFILVLLISATSMIGIVNSAPTYPIPTGPLNPPKISIESPTGTTYVSWFVPLKFSVTGSWDGYVNHCTVKSVWTMAHDMSFTTCISALKR